MNTRAVAFLVLSVTLAGRAAQGQTFNVVAAGLTGVSLPSAAWGDYDGDGDLDLIVTGRESATNSRVTKLYRNEGGPNPVFNSVATSLPDVYAGSTAWGDYDRDGDLDLLLTGFAAVPTIEGTVTRVYRNLGGPSPAFSDIGAGLTGVDLSSVAWGDYDNDGDLDILLTGNTGGGGTIAISKLYRNNGGANPTFTEIVGALPVGLRESSVAWGDYDNDGDLDILLTGQTQLPSARFARLYRNSGGTSPTFAEVAVGLVDVQYSAAAWGDYDNDGDLDILITGRGPGGIAISTIYRNSGGADPTFADIGAGLIGVYRGSAAWGDYDNDGYLDIVVTGLDNTLIPVSKVYRNQGGANPTFTDAGEALTGVGGGGTSLSASTCAWGDYDNDGDLDLLLAGDSEAGAITTLYRNSAAPANTPPTAPSGLHARGVGGATVEFSWDPASDAQTPATGLSYNLRIGTTPGGNQIFPAMANGANGYRRLPALGNANQRSSSTVTLPAFATYYWSVQAVDGAWAGSPFASEQTLIAVLDVGGAALPQVVLQGSIPNPFTRSTTLAYDLPRAERVRLEVFDSSGRRVRTLVSELAGAGRHEAVWDGTDSRGHRVAAGIYLYRLRAGSLEVTRRTVLMP